MTNKNNAGIDLDKLRAECRECAQCGHVGINDSSSTLAACHSCDWSGPSPVEDHCPGCADTNCMGVACPKCGALYELLAEADLARRAEPSVAAVDERVLAADLLQYLDEHDWGGIPECSTADRLRAALASPAVSEMNEDDELREVHLLHSEEQDILLMANYHATDEADGNYGFTDCGLLSLIRRVLAQYGNLSTSRGSPAASTMAVSQMDVAADAKDRRISYLEGLVRAYGPKSLQYDIEHPNDGLNAGTEPAATTASVPECRNCNDQGFADGDGCAYCGRMGPDADATTASASDPYDAPLDIHQHIAKEILADTVRRTQTPSREAAPVAQALLLEAATFLDNSMFQSLGQAGRAEELSARIRAALAQQGASHAPAAAQSICNDARFMAALDSYMDAVTYDERNSDKRIACRKAIFGAADAWAASFANSGASHAALDDNEVARLRRVVRELGMEKEVPQDDETLRGCLFSVLGQIAYKLESRASHAANAGEDTERLDLLLNISGFHFEIIDQEFYLLNARGRIAGKGATQRDAIDAAIASSAAQEGK